ncbi:hypothetical protein THRCLA_20802 [Thraustotheca clavata]|uniref:Uncharacterized protein n=1 Tax=Thraustotheca clavata TaxID=74557 RepID=A0A1W0A393_9STRA|nr:hypothetical protein THRCLA_20802 [Thraustotheca clavata]
MKVQREVVWITFIRLVAFSCTFYILFVDISGSIATNDSMKGISRKMINPDNHYTQSYILTFVQSIVQNNIASITTPTAQQPLNDSIVQMLYLDVIDPSDLTQLKLYQNGCREFMDSDHIYQPLYSSLLLHHVFDHQTWHQINLTSSWIILDCSYQGRTLGDTTAYKAHILDQSMKNLTTIFIQTMMMNRPQKEWFVSCGTATISNMDLSLLSWNGESLTSSQIATYNVMAAAEFPFENIPFEHVILLNPDSDTGAWDAIMTRTGEKVSICGSTGTYRYSPRTQGRFDYFVWQLPSNPVEYFGIIQWVNIVCSIDSWAWIRYRVSQHFLRIPDVYSEIRADLVVRDCSPILIYGEFAYDAVIRSELQFLSSHKLHLQVHPAVIMSIYYGCYMFHDKINAALIFCQSALSLWLYENYMLNTILANGEMDSWAFYENLEAS